MAEHETLKIWKRFVCCEEEKPRRIAPKSLLCNKYKYQGEMDEDGKQGYEEMMGYLAEIDNPIKIDQMEKIEEYKYFV